MAENFWQIAGQISTVVVVAELWSRPRRVDIRMMSLQLGRHKFLTGCEKKILVSCRGGIGWEPIARVISGLDMYSICSYWGVSRRDHAPQTSSDWAMRSPSLSLVMCCRLQTVCTGCVSGRAGCPFREECKGWQVLFRLRAGRQERQGLLWGAPLV